MPSILPNDFAALALHAGVIQTPHFLFFQPSTISGYIDLMVGTATGQNRMFSLNNKALFSNSGHPSGYYTGSSWSGDFYIDTYNTRLYYNTGNAWNTGVNLIGGTGGPGATGPAGAAGSGVSGLISGYTNEVLAKNSDTNYDYAWTNIGDILRANSYSSPKRFREIYRNLGLRGSGGSTISTDMGSGVTYNPLSNTLYVVDNGTPSIVEYSLDGQYIRTISLSGFKDVEAIDFMRGTTASGTEYYYFVIAEEYNAAGSAYLNRLSLLLVPLTGNVTITYNPGVGYHDYSIDLSAHLTNAAPNVGIEGVAYNPTQNIFYVVTEKTANEGWKCWKVLNQSSPVISALFDLTSPLASVSVTDISDICYRRDQNTLVMVSEEGAGGIIEFGVSGPDLGSILDFVAAPTTFYQLEGVAFSPNGRLMFLTGEANTVGGDKPDYILYEWNDGSNPTTDERSHGLTYFQNGLATFVRGKTFEVADPYNTTTNNTDKSLVSSWPVGSRYLHGDMIKRGRKLTFSSFGNFIPNTPITGMATLNFQVLDTGDSALTPLLTLQEVSCHNTGYWSYDGQIFFSESGYYNKSYATIHNNSGYSTNNLITASGAHSIFVTGDIDFVTKFSLPSTTGTMNVFQFSVEID